MSIFTVVRYFPFLGLGMYQVFVENVDIPFVAIRVYIYNILRNIDKIV